MAKDEAKEDLKRSQEALVSAKKNLEKGYITTTANRTFVACENAAYALLKTKFGSTPTSRQRILKLLADANKEDRKTYASAYDLRVQADYGREPTLLKLNKKNMLAVLKKVEDFVKKTEKEV